MAIIKSLAVGRAKGSAQDLTYSVVGGATIMKGKVAFPKNPKTVRQMNRRVTWANLVNLWQSFNQRDKPSFETKRPRVSDFNAFMGINIGGNMVYLSQSEANQGACVVAPYQVTEGSLPAIIHEFTNSMGVMTDIALGSLNITDETTLGEFSAAVIDNNENYENGDQIVFFDFHQSVNPTTHVPYVSVTSNRVTLNTDSEDYLSDLIPNAAGFEVINNRLGYSAAIVGGACYIHTRKAGDGSTLVSTQKIMVNNQILQSYQSDVSRISAILSYGGKTTADYLTPQDPMEIGSN